MPETVAKTGFDVDLYDPKAGDSYESISQDYYNNKRYAAALRAYNDGRPLQGGHYIDVPPIYVLQKKFPAQIGTGQTTPAGNVPRGSSTSGATDWGASPKPEPVPARNAATDRGTFTVPAGGMTIQEVARQVGVKWSDIYDLNKPYPPSELIPPGTQLRMPPDARLP